MLYTKLYQLFSNLKGDVKWGNTQYEDYWKQLGQMIKTSQQDGWSSISVQGCCVPLMTAKIHTIMGCRFSHSREKLLLLDFFFLVFKTVI